MLAFMCPRWPARSCTVMRMAASLLSTCRSAVQWHCWHSKAWKATCHAALLSQSHPDVAGPSTVNPQHLPPWSACASMCQPGMPWSVRVSCRAVHPVLPVRPTELSGVVHACPQGYAVGNGVTDEEIDGNAVIPFAYGQSLLSHDQYHSVHRECQGSFWNATQGKLDLPSSFLHL